MTESKTQAEEQKKASDAPIIKKKPESPRKDHGPQAAGPAHAGAHAGALLPALERSASALERAQKASAMQQKLGNARLGRIMGATTAPPATEPPVEEQEKGMDREHIPRVIAAREKAEELRHGR
jgi:hypothetical protein